MKKLRKIMAITLLALTACVFSSCGLLELFNKEPENPTPEQPSVVFDGFVNAEEINMIVGDKQTPATNFSGLNTQARFSSSAADIVSVSEMGELTALKQGEATITLTYGTYTDTLLIRSSFGEYVPILVFEEVIGEGVVININEGLNVSAKVFFNKKNFNPTTISYEILKEDGTMATNEEAMIEDGVFNATTTGKYTVNLSAQWSNFTGNGLTASVVIETIDAIELYVNDGSKTQFGFVEDVLYTTSDFDGKEWNNQIPFEIVAKENGEDVVPTLTWSNEECIEYDDSDNLLTGKAAGVTVLEIAYKKVKVEISIQVTPVEAVYNGGTITFSALDGKLDLEEIFGYEDAELYSAVQIENGEKTTEYEVKNNKIKGLESLVTSEGPANVSLLVSTMQAGYKVDLIVYTKVIKTQSDLLNAFQLREDNSTVNSSGQITVRTNAQDGYYILANDIEYNNEPYNVLADNVKYLFADYHKLGIKAKNLNKETKINETANLHSGGLTGTFDGNGYSIKNFVISEYGLFGMIQGGTVKNVNIENVSFVGRIRQMQMSLGASLYNATLENVNISTPKIAADVYSFNSTSQTYATEITSRTDYVIAPRALLAYTVGGTLTMKNCIFTVPEIYGSNLMNSTISGKHPSSMGALFCYITGTRTSETIKFEANVADTYVVSPVKLGYYIAGLEPRHLAYSYDTNEFINQFYTKYDENGNPTEDAELTSTSSSYYKQSAAVADIQSQLKNIVRYETSDKMLAAANDYASFKNSGYWSVVENGLPVWGKGA